MRASASTAARCTAMTAGSASRSSRRPDRSGELILRHSRWPNSLSVRVRGQDAAQGARGAPASAEEMTLEAERLEVAAEDLRDKLVRLVLAKG